ncbi:uncharacterized protein LOC133785126 [Humulus lupulus]|uniref:uncharacterized protein LOC133785126 n=1 Tax=Humulus lupulus TaxID=3486 RepID=UPI002B4142C2|nr:uncharacterized protein LOC133785126 [Humulus lupulus]
MVKFKDEAARDLVLESEAIHFDKKPVVLRPWTTDIGSLKSIKSVPVWIRLPDLGLQYWGVNCLSALLGHTIATCKFDSEAVWRKKDTKKAPASDPAESMENATTQDAALVNSAQPQSQQMGVSQSGESPKEQVWSYPKKSRALKPANPIPFQKTMNSFSVLQEQQKQISILDVCRLNKTGIGALLETKIKGEKLKEVMCSTFVGWDYYSSLRLEGRILLIWRASWVRIEAIQDHDQFFHCRVRICITIQEFCLTIVYASNQLEARRSLWYELAHLTFPVKPWVILGDFNVVFDPNDRMGGRPISVKELEDARQWLDLGLVEELKIMGSYYTWSNNQEGGNRIYSKLDRVFSNEDWLDSFPNVTAVSHWEVFRTTVLANWYKPLKVEGCGLEQVIWKLVRLKHVLNKFNWRVIRDVFKRHEKLYASFISQKSDWLRFGDENSSFFHASLKKRKIANTIVTFVSDGGRVEDNYQKVVNHFLQHFKNFLGSSSKALCYIDPVTIALGPVLNFDDQLELIKPFSYQDVKSAMFSINSIKSPGLDGFGAGFFKALWKDIGKEVSMAVLDFFETGYIPKFLNNTILALIPMVDNPINAADYRPIACYLSKGYNRKHCSPHYLMKIDISKAYDSIDWDFLENLLKALRFPGHFIKWIMVCLRGTSYCLLMNGRIQGCFQGGKGLRQGDPISPMLFVIVMDYLTRLLHKSSKEKDFRFHPLCKSLNIISLCFADDLLLFFSAQAQVHIVASSKLEIAHKGPAPFLSSVYSLFGLSGLCF